MSKDELTRRDLLKRGAGAVIATGAAAAGGFWLYDSKGDAGLRKPNEGGLRLKNYFADIDWPEGNPRISVATGREQDVERMVKAAIGGLDPDRGMKAFIRKDDVVLIKPNVGFDRAPRLGATSDPQVLRYVIRLCKEAGAKKVIVADNPIEAPDACFAKSGIQEAAEAEGAKVVLPSRNNFDALVIRDRAPNPADGEALGRWSVFYSPLAEATKVIGLAPIKDHNLCHASMNLKNWYGMLGGRRNQFHQAIHNIVSDLGFMMSPTLVIADGVRVMMKNGPTGGRVTDVKVGGEMNRPTIVAGVDPVACDAWCYRHLLGRDPAQLAYLEMAERKIGGQISAGMKRLGQRDWQAYDRQGKIVTTTL